MATFLSLFTMSIGLPFSSSIIFASSNSNSIAPRFILFSKRIFLSFSIFLNMGIKSSYSFKYSEFSFVSKSYTTLYDILLFTFITAFLISEFMTVPFLSISIIQHKVNLSSPALREQIPFDNL